MRLEGKIALVTGGARGIGEGIGRCLAAEGAKVALVDLDEEAALKTAASIGGGAIGLRGDAIEEGDVEGYTRRVADHFGGIDIYVNNAGAGRGPVGVSTENYGARSMTMSTAEWDEQLAQNLRSTFLGAKAGVPYLVARKGGSIINIASIAGLVASPTLPAYAAAKAGVISLTRSLALEHAVSNIRANAICPGLLWTRAWEGLATGMKAGVPAFRDMDVRDIFLEIVRRSVPLTREQTPTDIGKLAAFLCSDDAQNITGQYISVDGGITLRGG